MKKNEKNKAYWDKFNNKDYRENPNLLTEVLEYEYKFAEIVEEQWTDIQDYNDKS